MPRSAAERGGARRRGVCASGQGRVAGDWPLPFDLPLGPGSCGCIPSPHLLPSHWLPALPSSLLIRLLPPPPVHARSLLYPSRKLTNHKLAMFVIFSSTTPSFSPPDPRAFLCCKPNRVHAEKKAKKKSTYNPIQGFSIREYFRIVPTVNLHVPEGYEPELLHEVRPTVQAPLLMPRPAIPRPPDTPKLSPNE